MARPSPVYRDWSRCEHKRPWRTVRPVRHTAGDFGLSQRWGIKELGEARRGPRQQQLRAARRRAGSKAELGRKARPGEVSPAEGGEAGGGVLLAGLPTRVSESFHDKEKKECLKLLLLKTYEVTISFLS